MITSAITAITSTHNCRQDGYVALKGQSLCVQPGYRVHSRVN